MAWDNVPTKLAIYRTMQYGGTDAEFRLIAAFVPAPWPIAVENVPVAQRTEFELELDKRMGACKNLSNSRAIPPAALQT